MESGIYKFAHRLSSFLARVLMFAAMVMAVRAAQAGYTDNGNGTVTDSATGLTWMRCSVWQTWSAGTCSGEASTHTWTAARLLSASFAGLSDWRPPTIRELQSIVYRSVYGPATDHAAFPNTPDLHYWSASAYAGYSSYAWYIDFYSGCASAYGTQDDAFPMRLVRGAQALGLLDGARPGSDYPKFLS